MFERKFLAELNGAEAELEKRQILLVLERSNGNRTHAAKKLGISIRTLRNKLHEYGAADKDDTGPA